MTLEFLTDAQAEFYEAAVYYEDKEVGLGKRFRADVWDICSAILEHPLIWRVNCPVFPYYIAYFIRGDKVVVAAVAHASRHPDYWKQRLP